MTSKQPVIKIQLCSHLKGVKPGELPAELLRPIEGKGRLHHCAADAYEAMDAAANSEGIDLSPTSQADTYRSLETSHDSALTAASTSPDRTSSPKTVAYRAEASAGKLALLFLS